LSQRSLLDISASGAGSIQVFGRNLQTDTGSLLLSQNQGTRPGGLISVFVAEQLEFRDLTREGLRSGITSEAVNLGAGSPISVQAGTIVLQNGGGISTRTFSPAKGGDITVQTKQFDADGITPANVALTSGLGTFTLGTGSAGNITTSTQSLNLTQGAAISSFVFGRGTGGNVRVDASESVNISGENKLGSTSSISVVTLASGQAGNLVLNTRRLAATQGGTVAGSAFAMGRGGNVTVNASESIELTGAQTVTGSSINSSAVRLPAQFIPLVGNLQLTADAGTVSITTPNLILRNGAAIGVRNEGTGRGGEISITTNRLIVSNGFIRAITNSGEGGEIDIASDTIVLRDNSLIATTARGTGNGGNITLSSPIIVGFNNSDIVANAERGKGGSIQITTEGLFGLKYRAQLTSENDITASSEFGINGTVEITSPGVDPNSGLVELSSDLIDSNQQIAQNCAANLGSRFVITGRGGLPPNPMNDLMGINRTWVDLREPISSTAARSPQPEAILVEATDWKRNEKGQIELVAGEPMTHLSATCTR
jgi:large exoprotein involved in heme utilization and adhesion